VRSGTVAFDVLRVHILDIDPRVVRDTSVGQGLSHRQIRVLEVHVFADHRHDYLMLGRGYPLTHFDPVRQVRLALLHPQFLADEIRHALFLQRQRNVI